MFDIGFWEILLIAILAMVVIGPEKLPGAAKTAGRWFGKTRRFIEGVKTDVEKEFDVTDLKRMLHNQEVKIGELTQKLQNPKILDDELESITSSVYSIDDEAVDAETVDVETDQHSAVEKKDETKPSSLKTDE